MTEVAAARLRILGLAVIALCAILLALPIWGAKVDFTEAIGSLAAIGIGLMLLAEVGPMVKTLRAGALEVDFVETVGDRFGALERRVADLELKAAAGPAPRAALPAAAPALGRKVTAPDDPHKGRFGGASRADGFTVAATFRTGASGWVEIRLSVVADEAQVALGADDFAQFYLHDSFDPDMIPAPFVNGVAELSVIAYGGFTVGIWIPTRQVELELDLARVRGAPRPIRDL